MTTPPPRNPIQFLVDENGTPVALVDQDLIAARATWFGFNLAAASDDEPELDRITHEMLELVGPREFGYIAAGALRHVIENIVSPLMDIADAYGHPVGERMAEAAEHARTTLLGGAG